MKNALRLVALLTEDLMAQRLIEEVLGETLPEMLEVMRHGKWNQLLADDNHWVRRRTLRQQASEMVAAQRSESWLLPEKRRLGEELLEDLRRTRRHAFEASIQQAWLKKTEEEERLRVRQQHFETMLRLYTTSAV